MTNNTILCFDLGGSSIKYSLDLLTTIKTQSFNKINKHDVLEFISTIANKHHADEICISSPGIIDISSGQIMGYSAISEWKDFNLFSELKPLLINQQTKIYVDNDANCSLLGNVHELHCPIHSAVSITIGTGIGGAYYYDKHIVRGFRNSMCEIGMMQDLNDSHKTISTELSTNALCVYVNTQLKTNYNGEQIFDQVQNNNALVINLVNIWVQKNARFIYNIIWSYDPECIFIGGAISTNEHFQLLLINAVNKLFENINMLCYTRIIFANGGNRINLLGSLLLSDTYLKQ